MEKDTIHKVGKIMEGLKNKTKKQHSLNLLFSLFIFIFEISTWINDKWLLRDRDRTMTWMLKKKKKKQVHYWGTNKTDLWG